MNAWQKKLQISNTFISSVISLKAMKFPFSTQFLLKSSGLNVQYRHRHWQRRQWQAIVTLPFMPM